MAFTVVPGNIKQQFLPFVLDPDSNLNKYADNTSGSFKTANPQVFTFRTEGSYKLQTGILNFCPSSLSKQIDNDISYQLTYKQDQSGNQTTFSSMLNNLPGISIREYLPDTALDQAINFFTDLIKETMSLFGEKGIATEAKSKTQQTNNSNSTTTTLKADDTAADTESWLKKLTNVAWFVIKYITCVDDSNNIVKSMAKGNSTLTSSKLINKSNKNYQKIIDFPYNLYYKLQSCTTTNIYELPAIKTDKVMYSSDGAPGWDTTDSGFRFLPKSLQNIPMVGGFLGKLFGNIAISWTPWWDATKGNASIEPKVELEFDLFNDTSKSALMNFIFVNTIVPNNKWIQYGLFQHSSNLYDVKLEGYNRLFACTGQFTVTSNGILRDPPDAWFDDTKNGLTKYVNSNFLDTTTFLQHCKQNHLIKIPDVYHVKMTFDSVLPANFNNYLYSLVMNMNQITEYQGKIYTSSTLTSGLKNAVKDLVQGAKDAFKDDSGKYIENSTDSNNS